MSCRRRGPKASALFPNKLHIVLSNPNYKHIITWMPHGRSWRVLQPDVFSEIALPKYFNNQSKYSSFMRQVNGWGFKRITRGPDRNSYYHELFVRNNPELASTMTRRKVISAEVISANEIDTEPNFYETTPVLANNSNVSASVIPTYSAGIPSQLYGGVGGAGGFNYHDTSHLPYYSYDQPSHLSSSSAPHYQFHHPSQSIDPSLPKALYPYMDSSRSAWGESYVPTDNYSTYPSAFDISGSINSSFSTNPNLNYTASAADMSTALASYPYPTQSTYDHYYRGPSSLEHNHL